MDHFKIPQEEATVLITKNGRLDTMLQLGMQIVFR